MIQTFDSLDLSIATTSLGSSTTHIIPVSLTGLEHMSQTSLSDIFMQHYSTAAGFLPQESHLQTPQLFLCFDLINKSKPLSRLVSNPGNFSNSSIILATELVYRAISFSCHISPPVRPLEFPFVFVNQRQ